jgi:hypothetical protein
MTVSNQVYEGKMKIMLNLGGNIIPTNLFWTQLFYNLLIYLRCSRGTNLIMYKKKCTNLKKNKTGHSILDQYKIGIAKPKYSGRV